VARARLRAVETGKLVSLCPRAAAARCRTDTDWSHGWLVFDDPGRRGQPSGPPAVREEEVLDGGQISIESTRGRRLLSFRSDGSSAGSNVTLSLCHPGHPGVGRQLIISNVGRLRSDDLPNAWACRPPS
jgi:type IV fimbrial biogenesis protein FimT